MQTQPNEERHERQPRTRPRFRIEKLEERIAPTKGNVPGHAYHCPWGQWKKGNCYGQGYQY